MARTCGETDWVNHARVLRARRLGGVELDRGIEALELEGPRMTIRHVRSGALIDRLRHENLVGFGDRLGAGGRVDDGADGGEVAVRSAELPKTEFARVLLDLPGREQRIPGMVLALQRKIEDRHDGVADGLVEEPLMLPDRARA